MDGQGDGDIGLFVQSQAISGVSIRVHTSSPLSSLGWRRRPSSVCTLHMSAGHARRRTTHHAPRTTHHPDRCTACGEGDEGGLAVGLSIICCTANRGITPSPAQ